MDNTSSSVVKDYSKIFTISKKKVIEVIGEGSYGCVHKPSLECKQSNNKINYKNKISKLLMSEDAEQESNEYDIIAKYDKQNKYFLGKPITCDVKMTPSNLAAINECENGDEFIDNIEDAKLLIMNYGGENLEVIAKEFSRMKRTPNNVAFATRFLIEAKHIFSAIYFLHKHNIIHHDLKPQNMVYYKKTNKLKLIDFGFTTYKDKVINLSKNSNNRLSKCHWSYPLEINFYNSDKYKSFAKYSQEEKDKYYNNITNNLDIKEHDKCSTTFSILFYYIIDKRTSETEKNKIINMYFSDYKKMLDDIIECNYENFLKKSVETIDLYGAGIAFCLLFKSMKHLLDKPIIDKLDSLCYHMITPDLSKRYSIKKAIIKYNEILDYFRKKI
jgi:serine/threonine protein kinase